MDEEFKQFWENQFIIWQATQKRVCKPLFWSSLMSDNAERLALTPIGDPNFGRILAQLEYARKRYDQQIYG